VSDSLSISRNGESVEVSLDEHGAFVGAELKKLGVVSFDQPLLSTATARSAITYIDGDAGILRYRGYPIDQLAEHKHFLEVAYLLARGELASEGERQAFRRSVYDAPVDRERIAALVGSFPAGSPRWRFSSQGMRRSARSIRRRKRSRTRRCASASSRSCSPRRSSSARRRSRGTRA
jgi:citrate synthase